MLLANAHAVVAIIVGQALLLGQRPLLTYALGVSGLFVVFVKAHEEPTLRRRYREQYDAYCRVVPGWIPHFDAGRRR